MRKEHRAVMEKEKKFSLRSSLKKGREKRRGKKNDSDVPSEILRIIASGAEAKGQGGSGGRSRKKKEIGRYVHKGPG